MVSVCAILAITTTHMENVVRFQKPLVLDEGFFLSVVSVAFVMNFYM